MRLHDSHALIQLLCHRAAVGDKSIVFLVGAPLARPIPETRQMIALMREELAAAATGYVFAEGDRSLTQQYQDVFEELSARAGPDVVQRVVRRAVLRARHVATPRDGEALEGIEAACQALEEDLAGWTINPALQAIGEICARHPRSFGQLLLTTNFDPLIETSIWRAGGTAWRTMLHLDGSLQQSAGRGCHVVHLHGYWHGVDTLHTTAQLRQSRPRLRSSLATILQARMLVVLAYGGWDDVFREALLHTVQNDAAAPEILWTVHAERQEDINPAVLDVLQPAISRGRAVLYGGVDVHRFLPELAAELRTRRVAPAIVVAAPTPRVQVREVWARPEPPIVTIVFDMKSETDRVEHVIDLRLSLKTGEQFSASDALEVASASTAAGVGSGYAPLPPFPITLPRGLTRGALQFALPPLSPQSAGRIWPIEATCEIVLFSGERYSYPLFICPDTTYTLLKEVGFFAGDDGATHIRVDGLGMRVAALDPTRLGTALDALPLTANLALHLSILGAIPALHAHLVAYLARQVHPSPARRRDATHRYFAYVALGRLGGRAAIEVLRAGLQDPDSFAAQGARDAFMEVST